MNDITESQSVTAPVFDPVDHGLVELDPIFNALIRWAQVSQSGCEEDVKHAFDTTVEQLGERGKELVTQIEGDLATIIMQGEKQGEEPA